MARHTPSRGTLGTPFPLVDALDREWNHGRGYMLPEDGPAWIESHRSTLGIPDATERYARPEPRTKMVIVPTWFVHGLAVDLPTPRR